MPTFDAFWSTYCTYYAPKRLFPTQQIPLKHSHCVPSLLEISDHFDVLLLDGFGVLNVGTEAIPPMPAIINTLVDQGKHAFVLTNGASYPTEKNAKRYPALGYPISEDQVISSRNALEEAIETHPLTKNHGLWGVISAPDYGTQTLKARTTALTQANLDTVEGFIFLGTLDWDQHKNRRWIEAVLDKPRPILVANPDVCAPLMGTFSIEPGTYLAQLLDHPEITIEFYGKPFQSCYALSHRRIEAKLGPTDPTRILMVGDTLHTDILGGNTFGMKTALMTDWGFLRNKDPLPYIEAAQISPDFIISQKLPL